MSALFSSDSNAVTAFVVAQFDCLIIEDSKALNVERLAICSAGELFEKTFFKRV